MSAFRFNGPPPPAAPEEPTYPVLRIQKHGPLDLVLLNNTILSVNTHWCVSDTTGQGASFACTQYEPHGCLIHDDPMEWSGWVAVWDCKQRRKSVLRLAPREADVMLSVLGVDLRWHGVRVELNPVNHGAGKRCRCAKHPHQVPMEGIDTFSIRRTVCKTLCCPSIPLQSPPPGDPDDIPTDVRPAAAGGGQP